MKNIVALFTLCLLSHCAYGMDGNDPQPRNLPKRIDCDCKNKEQNNTLREIVAHKTAQTTRLESTLTHYALYTESMQYAAAHLIADHVRLNGNFAAITQKNSQLETTVFLQEKEIKRMRGMLHLQNKLNKTTQSANDELRKQNAVYIDMVDLLAEVYKVADAKICKRPINA